MQFFLKLVIIGIAALNLQASWFITTPGELSITLPNENVILYNGIPVKVISKGNQSTKIEISGYVNPSDKMKLYATENLRLLSMEVKDEKKVIVVNNRGTVTITVPNNILTEDQDEAWQTNSDLFYDKCTKCHHAKVVKNHNMLEWEALFNSMKLKAKTTPDEDELIMRFLRAFAKDGILTESD